MGDTEVNKLKGEISRREAELRSCELSGYSAYNDYLSNKVRNLKKELSEYGDTGTSGYGAFT